MGKSRPNSHQGLCRLFIANRDGHRPLPICDSFWSTKQRPGHDCWRCFKNFSSRNISGKCLPHRMVHLKDLLTYFLTASAGLSVLGALDLDVSALGVPACSPVFLSCADMVILSVWPEKGSRNSANCPKVLRDSVAQTVFRPYLSSKKKT